MSNKIFPENVVKKNKEKKKDKKERKKKNKKALGQLLHQIEKRPDLSKTDELIISAIVAASESE